MAKQFKYKCPSCNDKRMLNAGVTLAICQRPGCNLVNFVPEQQKLVKRNKDKKIRKIRPMVCSKCGMPVTDLTIFRDRGDYGKVTEELCYDCISGKKSSKVCSNEIIKQLVEDEQ